MYFEARFVISTVKLFFYFFSVAAYMHSVILDEEQFLIRGSTLFAC